MAASRKTETREYRMVARGESVAETRRRILAAVRSIAYARLEFEPTLAAVAEEAGVSVQTVLRHFSSREALLSAATEAARSSIADERRPSAADVDTALTTLIAHYELRGEFVLAMLARERTDASIGRITDSGRAEHRRWVAEVFAAHLPEDPRDRDALLDLLVVATDVYAWKLLRRDRGHDVPVVHARMRAMTDALLARREDPR